MNRGVALALMLLLGCSGISSAQNEPRGAYFGKELGPLSELHHAVRGRVFAVDSRTLFIKDFHYDGEGPAAYFYVGSSGAPSGSGVRLRDERGGSGPLKRYRGEGVTLSLPDGHTLRDIRWFSVWCDEFSVNFGDVRIPRDLEYPRPAKVGALHGVHGVSSDPVLVVDAQTLLVPNFSYDGEAPDAKFWVGRGDKPSPQGIRIPDENGKETPLRKYDKKTIVLTLPGELTVFDIGHFAVWCEAFTVNFGHVVLPRAALGNVPPSLKMLGVSPQSRNKALVSNSVQARPPSIRKPLQRLDATTYRPPRLGAGPLAALLDQPADHNAHLHRRADDYTPPPQQLLSQQDRHHYQQQQFAPAQNNQQLQYQPQPQPQSQLLQQNYYQPQEYRQQPTQEQIDRLLYQQRLYEEQQRAYERDVSQGRYQEEPFQYRLLPYENGRTIVDPIQRSVTLT